MTNSTDVRRVLLEVSTIGEAEVRLAGSPVTFATRHATCALLWLCVADGARIPVTEMATALWPMAAESRLARRTATMTWQIRRALGDAAHLVVRTRDALRVDPSMVAVDLLEARFAAKVAHAASAQVPAEAAAVLASDHCTPFAEMAWVQEVMATNRRLLHP